MNLQTTLALLLSAAATFASGQDCSEKDAATQECMGPEDYDVCADCFALHMGNVTTAESALEYVEECRGEQACTTCEAELTALIACAFPPPGEASDDGYDYAEEQEEEDVPAPPASIA